MKADSFVAVEQCLVGTAAGACEWAIQSLDNQSEIYDCDLI